MCLAIPAQIEKMEDKTATVVLAGSRTNVSLALVPEAKLGDWVLVHAGYALTILDPQEARETYELLAQIEVDEEEVKRASTAWTQEEKKT
ncbi:MAG: HypC/HybG/HupF family hydrogenase formation chaperone [Phycisphaerae bacterium]|jgi:hydrogenase expression/formation protein HypC